MSLTLKYILGRSAYNFSERRVISEYSSIYTFLDDYMEQVSVELAHIGINPLGDVTRKKHIKLEDLLDSDYRNDISNFINISFLNVRDKENFAIELKQNKDMLDSFAVNFNFWWCVDSISTMNKYHNTMDWFSTHIIDQEIYPLIVNNPYLLFNYIHLTKDYKILKYAEYKTLKFLLKEHNHFKIYV
jgi:hypothetical protein